MSSKLHSLKIIENLSVEELVKALDDNGYGECGTAILYKNIDGKRFLNLNEFELNSWKQYTDSTQLRRLWSFVQRIKDYPNEFIIKTAPYPGNLKKPPVSLKPRLPPPGNNNPDSLANKLSNALQNRFKNDFANKLEQVLKKPQEDEGGHDEFGEYVDMDQHKTVVGQNFDSIKRSEQYNEQLQSDEDDGGYLTPTEEAKEHFFNKPKNDNKSNENTYTPDPIFKRGTVNTSSFLRKYQEKQNNQINESSTITRRNAGVPLIGKPKAALPSQSSIEAKLPPKPQQFVSKVHQGKIPIKIEQRLSQEKVEDVEENEYEAEPLLQKALPKFSNYPHHRPLPPLPTEFAFSREQPVPVVSIQTKDEEEEEVVAEYAELDDPIISFQKEIRHKDTSDRHQTPLRPPIQITKDVKQQRSEDLTKTGRNDKLFRRPPPPDVAFLEKQISTSPLLEIRNLLTPSPTSPVLGMRNLPTPPIKFPITKSPLPQEEFDDYDEIATHYTEANLQKERSYRDTDRKGARRLLQGLEDGAFVIRPSRQKGYFCSITIMYKKKIYNIGVENGPNHTFKCGDAQDHTPFRSIKDIIEYYSSNPLPLIEKTPERNTGEICFVYLRDVLPKDRL